MTIIEAWSELRRLGESSLGDKYGDATMALINACQSMKEETVGVSVRKVPEFVAANCRDYMDTACDLKVLKTASRLLACDPGLTDDNPEGYLQTLMIYACIDELDKERTGDFKTSYTYRDIEGDIGKQESFNIEQHDLPYEERGYQIVDAIDFVEVTFADPFDRMLVECVRDDCEINFTSISKSLGCDRKTVRATFNESVARVREHEGEYALGV